MTLYHIIVPKIRVYFTTHPRSWRNGQLCSKVVWRGHSMIFRSKFFQPEISPSSPQFWLLCVLFRRFMNSTSHICFLGMLTFDFYWYAGIDFSAAKILTRKYETLKQYCGSAAQSHLSSSYTWVTSFYHQMYIPLAVVKQYPPSIQHLSIPSTWISPRKHKPPKKWAK